jgi:hypothetical protein
MGKTDRRQSAAGSQNLDALYLTPEARTNNAGHPERSLAGLPAKRSQKPALSEAAKAAESNGDLHLKRRLML